MVATPISTPYRVAVFAPRTRISVIPLGTLRRPNPNVEGLV